MGINNSDDYNRVPFRERITESDFEELEEKYPHEYDRSLSYISIMSDFFNEDFQELIMTSDAGIVSVLLFLRVKMASTQDGYFIDITSPKDKILFKNMKYMLNLTDEKLRQYMQSLVNAGWIQRLTLGNGDRIVLLSKESVQNFETINEKRAKSRKSTQEARERAAQKKLEKVLKKNKVKEVDGYETGIPTTADDADNLPFD